MGILFLIVFFFVSFLIVGLVLLQEGKGGGLTGMSTGMDGVMGAKNPLRRMTAYLFVVFVLMAVSINWYFHDRSRSESTLPAGAALPVSNVRTLETTPTAIPAAPAALPESVTPPPAAPVALPEPAAPAAPAAPVAAPAETPAPATPAAPAAPVENVTPPAPAAPAPVAEALRPSAAPAASATPVAPAEPAEATAPAPAPAAAE